jgi:hypothetical protein
MAYEFKPLTKEQVLAAVKSAPGLKQPQLLAVLYPPLDDSEAPYGREADPTGRHPEGGNPVKAPHIELEKHLRALRAEHLVDYTPKGAAGGWR